MEGMVLCHLDPIDWRPEIAGYQQSGDVADWDEPTLTIGLSEPPDFGGSATTWLTLMRDDGTLTTPVEVTRGPTDYDIVLPAAPDFDVVFDRADRERTRFYLGHLDMLVRVTSITDGGKSDAEEGVPGVQLYDIEGFVDDARVHAVDLHLLPGPGDIQDPIDDGADSGDTNQSLALVHIVDAWRTYGQPTGGGAENVTLNFFNDGTMNIVSHVDTLENTETINASWLAYPVEPEQVAQFEILATSAYTPSAGDPLNTWLQLDASRSWTFNGPDRNFIELRVQIRRVGQVVVDGQAKYTLFLNIENLSPGGA